MSTGLEGQEPPPFVQPPPAHGTWQDQYFAHVNFFRRHFATQLAPRAPVPLPPSDHEDFLEASEELYGSSAVARYGSE
jgi:hypothetical protein